MYDADGELTIAVTGVDESVTASVSTLITTTGDSTVDAWDVTDTLFDANGNVTETIDGANLTASLQRITTTMFDEFGDVTGTIDATGAMTTNLVDNDGETTETIERAGPEDVRRY